MLNWLKACGLRLALVQIVSSVLWSLNPKAQNSQKTNETRVAALVDSRMVVGILGKPNLRLYARHFW